MKIVEAFVIWAFENLKPGLINKLASIGHMLMSEYYRCWIPSPSHNQAKAQARDYLEDISMTLSGRLRTPREAYERAKLSPGKPFLVAENATHAALATRIN